jgi:uncharacterized tellurite resistance protein B-like protein
LVETVDPEVNRVVAVIDLLLTVGYIDGRLQDSEQTFIRQYLDQVVDHVAQGSGTHEQWRARVDAAYGRLDSEIAGLAAEVVASGDERFMSARLKTRAVALFHEFSPGDQKVALALLDAVMHTDGAVSPQESALHAELLSYFHATPQLPEPVIATPVETLRIDATESRPVATFTHPWLDAIEQRYAHDPAALQAQVAGDYSLVFQAITVWERQRSRGNGRLLGVTDIGQLPADARLLDGHVHVQRSTRPTELIVLGDLHGCYACFKAAVLQSKFIERALAREDVQLVLLGDYIDRGTFGFEGVLRGALQLLVSLPDNVVMLRGNHELLVRLGDTVVSAVNPAEAVPGISGLVPVDMLEAYRHLFEHMPTSLLFERILFVHGGIPRDDTLANRYHDLSSLDDSVVRFEMMWGDPVQTDHVPVELQRETPRFGFGRDQFRAFMHRIGCHTLIRGHEQVDPGFVTAFDLGHHRLHTLFSAGGRDNSDLPAESRYRNVTPMALSIYAGDGPLRAVPWQIQYQDFARGAHNGLYR